MIGSSLATANDHDQAACVGQCPAEKALTMSYVAAAFAAVKRRLNVEVPVWVVIACHTC
jgi:hypothetical protein